MTPIMLRQLWSLVEATQTHILLSLDDSSLVQWLLGGIKAQQALDGTQASILATYIHSRLTLIRDLAEER